jgi:folylpolyglutamate synthase/dihydropteroate synthase
MQKSKDHAACSRLLGNRRTITVNDVSSEVEVAAALKRAHALTNENDMIFVCGSLYLAGNALKYFKTLSN